MTSQNLARSSTIAPNLPVLGAPAKVTLYQQGQRVRYQPVGETNTAQSTGTITSVLTESGQLGGISVDASEANPRYEIENDRTHRKTTVYEKNIVESI